MLNHEADSSFPSLRRRKVLVVEDPAKPDCDRLKSQEFSSARGSQLTVAAGFDEAKLLLNRDRDYDMAFIEVDLPHRESFVFLREFRRECPKTPVIMFADYGDEELWLDVMDQGACDLVTRPELVDRLDSRK